MSLATYLLVPAGSEAAFKQAFFRTPHARRYPFLSEAACADTLRHTPSAPQCQPVVIDMYSGVTLLDKGAPSSAARRDHKATPHHQQTQQTIATLEEILGGLRELKHPFGFGVLDLGLKRGWQRRVNITDFPAAYEEGTLYWLTP